MSNVIQQFIFGYYLYPYLPSGSDKKYCPVEIERLENSAVVTITEPDNAAVNKEIRDDYPGIATQIYRARLSDLRSSQIKWQLHTVRNADGFEVLEAVTLKFDGLWFWKASFAEAKVIDNYSVCGISKTDDHLCLKIGLYHNQREVTLPIDRFPSLKRLTDKELKQITLHKHNTVIHWNHLDEKLVVRDAVLFGDGTIRRPNDMSLRKFQYEAVLSSDSPHRA